MLLLLICWGLERVEWAFSAAEGNGNCDDRDVSPFLESRRGWRVNVIIAGAVRSFYCRGPQCRASHDGLSIHHIGRYHLLAYSVFDNTNCP